ncbi:MAG: BMC domain-containing protein [Anaerolineae bacterium]
MTSKALGLIETIGLAAAIEAADAAIKTADVKLLGYENTRGGGRITVKFVGEVGAVKAAVASGSAAALRIGQVESCLIIPRPHEEIEVLINQIDRGRSTPPAAPAKKSAPVKAEKPKAASEAVKAPAPQVIAPKPKPATAKKGKQPPAPPKLETPEPAPPAPIEELPPPESDQPTPSTSDQVGDLPAN